ncbi:MAG: 50S ribosomal protein L29 [Alphaproteobacteria bacterium]|nr:50S ribosomal protein L29 [Alphaproteobacteria bacterium]
MAKKSSPQTAEDLQGKSPDELRALLLDLRKQQMDMRFSVTGGQMKDTSQFRKVRRMIARIKTSLNTGASQQSARPTAR